MPEAEGSTWDMTSEVRSLRSGTDTDDNEGNDVCTDDDDDDDGIESEEGFLLDESFLVEPFCVSSVGTETVKSGEGEACGRVT